MKIGGTVLPPLCKNLVRPSGSNQDPKQDTIQTKQRSGVLDPCKLVMEVDVTPCLSNQRKQVFDEYMSSGRALHPTPYEIPRDISSRFGARLRELRRERKMTQFRMAIDFGIDRSYISDLERGRKSASLPMLEVIALGLNVSLSDLLRDV